MGVAWWRRSMVKTATNQNGESQNGNMPKRRLTVNNVTARPSSRILYCGHFTQYSHLVDCIFCSPCVNIGRQICVRLNVAQQHVATDLQMRYIINYVLHLLLSRLSAHSVMVYCAVGSRFKSHFCHFNLLFSITSVFITFSAYSVRLRFRPDTDKCRVCRVTF